VKGLLGRLSRHLAARTLRAFLAALGAVVGLFLAVDYAENASIYRGPGWVLATAELYLNRAAVVAGQLAPAAMLLAAAVTASGLRKTREYTALRSLGLGPVRVAIPVVAVCAAIAVGLAAFGDVVVVRAGERDAQIMADKFHRTDRDILRSREPRRWFRGRGGHRIYHLRGTGEGGSYERVTILELGAGFRLTRRIDAARMRPGTEDKTWVLEDVEDRVFSDPPEYSRVPERTYRFDEDPAAFALRGGIPSQLRRAVLGEQIALRARLGLPTADYALEWYRRLSYPLAGIPAALVALALALRRERKGHLTAALVEAIGVSFVYWGLDGVALSLGHAGRLPPGVAAWAPAAVFLVAGAVALRRIS
jgi:lipopolysaccharide export system permease protein